jgi:ABC-type oligopeptide transport system substrate-binding subunit
MKYLATVRFPPDYDGELHIHVNQDTSKAVPYLEINLTLSIGKDENVKEALTRLGRMLLVQPLSVREKPYGE